MEEERNPFLKRAAKRGTTGHGSVSEKRVGLSLGARMTAASGAKRSDKGDMKLQKGEVKLRIEAKSTTSNSMKLELGWMVKILDEAIATNCKPALSVSFVTPEGKARPYGDWVMVPKTDFEEYVDALSKQGQV